MTEKRKVPDKALEEISGGSERLNNPTGHSPTVPSGKPTTVQIGEDKDDD